MVLLDLVKIKHKQFLYLQITGVKAITSRAVIGDHMLFEWYNFHACLRHNLSLIFNYWKKVDPLLHVQGKRWRAFVCLGSPSGGFDYLSNELLSWIQPSGTTQHSSFLGICTTPSQEASKWPQLRQGGCGPS